VARLQTNDESEKAMASETTSETGSELIPGENDLMVTFLAQGAQTGAQIATMLSGFIAGAMQTLDIAAYDFRLEPETAAIVAAALRERAAAGVRIRIAYDSDRALMVNLKPNLMAGMDPALSGTETFVESLNYPSKGISGLKLMHNKYVVRDADQSAAQVWTGSTNLDDAAWTLQENNILRIASAQLASYYAEDFEQLWQTGEIGESGNFGTREVALTYRGEPAHVRVLFAPGGGETIDALVAQTVRRAFWRVRICTMLLNAGNLLNALSDLLAAGEVPVDGVYDRTQMAEVLVQWQEIPHNRWKIGAFNEIVARAGLVGKNSTPYTPTSVHDFMHDKILVVDDTVITGSYNFSRSAEFNAENILFIDSRPLAVEYSAYIDRLIAKYGPSPAAPQA
jgi:phosphatidylserine/phosphatidylglycerophosphate/cardiolipin synthase-like enzyme